MIAASWILFTLFAMFWTGAAWVTAAATRWTAQALASGSAAEAARDLAAVPLPEWLAPWIDPGWLQALRSAVEWSIDAAGAVLPLAGPAVAWLVPLIWTLWGLGMILLLAGAAGAHVVVRRVARRR